LKKKIVKICARKQKAIARTSRREKKFREAQQSSAFKEL